jgi:hypothetical protein
VRDKTPIELGGLVLQPGPWGLSVSRAKQGVEYRIGLSGRGPIQADTEAEPNDAIEFASGVPANNRIKGGIRGEEDDYFRFTVADEPQLWRFQVIGEDLGRSPTTMRLASNGRESGLMQVRAGRVWKTCFCCRERISSG